MLNMKKTLSGLALVASVSASGFALAEGASAPMVISINGSITLPACQPELIGVGTNNDKTVNLPNYNVDPNASGTLDSEVFGDPLVFEMNLKPLGDDCLLPVKMQAFSNNTQTVNGATILSNIANEGAQNVGIQLKVEISGGGFENLINLGEFKLSELKFGTGSAESHISFQAEYFKMDNTALETGLVQTSTTMTFVYN
jgi:type 1 fimbria pilin